MLSEQTVPHAPSSPLEGEPNRFFNDLVGGAKLSTISAFGVAGITDTPHQKAEAFWLPLKGGAAKPASRLNHNYAVGA